ncbi:3-isopropylmalate dehydratase small subunit [Spirochaetia bacterium 38H-sp]|uniref:3-isopropylmalate dehydratase n=1 Tax=Rarispira pelagica TaxID=3141764 RepID=A0ABU9U8J4_9SPIR
MSVKFGGKVLFLDRADINTDEIIPAKYLTEVSKEALKPYLLEDLKLDGFEPGRDLAGVKVIVARENFGCGSSREHAVWALEVNDISCVIAPGFARIFRGNMFNCGLLAIELSAAEVDELFADFAGKEVEADIDVDNQKIIFKTADKTKSLSFELGGFEKELVKTGGWIEYADKKY